MRDKKLLIKEWLKKYSFRLFIFAAWICVLTIWIRECRENGERKRSAVSQETFMETASIDRKEDWVGANIWLKQAIHGTKDVKYRYVIKTDCPSWDYETRYMTTTPISWIDETSAVEVLIYDTSIRFSGTVYANGTYFLIPILDDLASEPVSLDEWEIQLMEQAYHSYLEYIGAQEGQLEILSMVVFCAPVVWLITTFMFPLIFGKKEGHGIDH